MLFRNAFTVAGSSITPGYKSKYCSLFDPLTDDFLSFEQSYSRIHEASTEEVFHPDDILYFVIKSRL